MAKGDIIQINIKDWREMRDSILRDETVSLETVQDIIDSLILQYGLTSTQAGHVLISLKQGGLLPDTIDWPEHKHNLSRGGAMSASLLIKTAVREKELANGKTIKARRFLGRGNVGDEAEEKEEGHRRRETHIADAAPYVATDTPAGVERARNYLLNIVPGHIRARFNELAGAVDIREVGEELKAKIDELVSEFE